jgi:hypothetical protein
MVWLSVQSVHALPSRSPLQASLKEVLAVVTSLGKDIIAFQWKVWFRPIAGLLETTYETVLMRSSQLSSLETSS